MGKKNQEEAAVVDEAEAKRQRKLAKKAAKEAAAAASEEEAPAPEKKKKKKQAAEEAPAEEVDEAEAKRQRKAAKRAAKEAAAAAEAAAEEVDEEEAKRQRKAAKKAAKAAAAAEAEAEAEAPVKKSKKEKRAEADDDEAPPAKKAKSEDNGAAAEGEKSLKVFVKGLPYSVDEPTFRKDFEECGAVTQIQFPLNEEGKPKGFAFVTYASQEGFDAALKFDNTDYGGRFISVTKANDSGKGKDGKGGKGKGKAGDWECPNCGDNVFARNDACRKCGTARPGGAAGGGGKGDGKGARDNANTVFVRGLPWAVTEDALRKDFAECGEIEKLTFPLNEEGRPKGIAFIKYTAEAGVEAALKFDNTDYGGRTINVSKAEDRGGKGKDGKGKGKDGKGKDGKGKGKKGKGKAPSEAKAKNTGAILESTGEKKTFDDSDDDE